MKFNVSLMNGIPSVFSSVLMNGVAVFGCFCTPGFVEMKGGGGGDWRREEILGRVGGKSVCEGRR